MFRIISRGGTLKKYSFDSNRRKISKDRGEGVGYSVGMLKVYFIVNALVSILYYVFILLELSRFLYKKIHIYLVKSVQLVSDPKKKEKFFIKGYLEKQLKKVRFKINKI